jgi:hypothetical protein
MGYEPFIEDFIDLFELSNRALWFSRDLSAAFGHTGRLLEDVL